MPLTSESRNAWTKVFWNKNMTPTNQPTSAIRPRTPGMNPRAVVPTTIPRHLSQVIAGSPASLAAPAIHPCERNPGGNAFISRL